MNKLQHFSISTFLSTRTQDQRSRLGLVKGVTILHPPLFATILIHWLSLYIFYFYPISCNSQLANGAEYFDTLLTVSRMLLFIM